MSVAIKKSTPVDVFVFIRNRSPAKLFHSVSSGMACSAHVYVGCEFGTCLKIAFIHMIAEPHQVCYCAYQIRRSLCALAIRLLREIAFSIGVGLVHMVFVESDDTLKTCAASEHSFGRCHVCNVKQARYINFSQWATTGEHRRHVSHLSCVECPQVQLCDGRTATEHLCHVGAFLRVEIFDIINGGKRWQSLKPGVAWFRTCVFERLFECNYFNVRFFFPTRLGVAWIQFVCLYSVRHSVLVAIFKRQALRATVVNGVVHKIILVRYVGEIACSAVGILLVRLLVIVWNSPREFVAVWKHIIRLGFIFHNEPVRYKDSCELRASKEHRIHFRHSLRVKAWQVERREVAAIIEHIAHIGNLGSIEILDSLNICQGTAIIEPTIAISRSHHSEWFIKDYFLNVRGMVRYPLWLIGGRRNGIHRGTISWGGYFSILKCQCIVGFWINDVWTFIHSAIFCKISGSIIGIVGIIGISTIVWTSSWKWCT